LERTCCGEIAAGQGPRLREERAIASFAGSGSYVVPDTNLQRPTFFDSSGIEDIELGFEFRIFLDRGAPGLPHCAASALI
jgi:hypothetical protein